ncbi:MAG: cobalt ABC transporter [Rhodovulum sp.]|jgi:biotin transport system ATP-binding protein|nr:cobalt ABC transporter [Rhodovulum sp.]
MLIFGQQTTPEDPVPQPTPPLIEVSDLRYAPQGRVIFDGLSVSLDARRIGIIGRNGSGKTTLARMLGGLIEPDQGCVRVAGIDVARDRRTVLKRIGILFQNPDHQIIFPTVDEEIGFGLRQLGHPKSAIPGMVNDVLARFDKTHWQGRIIAELSQGQRHLVCLMAVLAMGPDVLILDEPFAGLDIPTRMQLTRYLNLSDASIIHVTHDPADLGGYDTVFWLDGGAVRATGTPDQVLPVFVDAMTKLGAGDDISDLTG